MSNSEDGMKEGKKVTSKKEDLGQLVCALDSCETGIYINHILSGILSHFTCHSPQLIQISLRQLHCYYYYSLSKYALSSTESLGLSSFMVYLGPSH